MNITMVFTETKERVEFTSEHVYEVPKEADSNQKKADQSTHEPEQPQEVNQTDEVPKQQQKRKASTEAEEPRHAKMRQVLNFESTLTSHASEMDLPPTPRDPFKKGTRSKNAEDPCPSPPGSPASLSPTHEGPPATPRDPFKGNSIREAKSPMGQQEVQIDEGNFIELEVEGQNSEFPDDATRSESPLKKNLEALQEKVKKQKKKTKKLKEKKPRKLKEQVTNQKEATHTNAKVPSLMNINIKTPEKLQKFRRSRAENLVKNCGICSKKEAGNL